MFSIKHKKTLLTAFAIAAGVVFPAAPMHVQAAQITIETESSSQAETVETTAAQTTVYEEPQVIINNEVELDPDTGEPVEESEKETKTTVTLKSGLTYDAVSGVYTQTYGSGEGQYVSATVVSGMITNQPVSMALGEGITGTLYKDGEEVVKPNLTAITECGNYAMRLSGSAGEDLGTFSFRIIGAKSNITEYKLPDTFSTGTVTWEGYSLWNTGSTIPFEDEGTYNVTYFNDVTGLQYSLTVTIDHTPPVLALEAVNEKNIARSAVDISDLEEGTSITVICDGNKVSTNGKLTSPGKYQLTLHDEAGNITTYAFTIYMYFTMSGIAVVLILLALQAALVAYLIITRKKTRVR